MPKIAELQTHNLKKIIGEHFFKTMKKKDNLSGQIRALVHGSIGVEPGGYGAGVYTPLNFWTGEGFDTHFHPFTFCGRL